MRARVLGGVAGALDVHTAFRNGATIRALEQIQLSESDPDEKAKIEEVLDEIPKVLFLESRLDDNVYCKSLVNTGRTNIDAFSRGIRDLPIRMAARSFLPVDGETDETDGLLNLIKSEQPELIVAHLSTFESENKDRKTAILKEIMQDTVDLDPNYFPSLILYSRLPPNETKGKLIFPSRGELLGKENSDISFFATIAMVGDSDSDADCFLGKSENTLRLREQVDLAVSHQNLYGRDFSK